MVNKEFEEQFSELTAAILLMPKELKKEMAAEFREQLKEVKESLQHDMLLMEKRLADICLLKKKHDCMETTNAEDDEPTLSGSSSETEDETNQILKKLTHHQTDYFLKLSFDAYSGSDSSDCENWDEQDKQVPSGTLDGFQAASGTEKNSCSSFDSVEYETSLMKEYTEEKNKRSPSNRIFMTNIPKSTGEGVDASNIKDTKALLMEAQWKKWMDQQEFKGSFPKVKRREKRNTREQKGSADNELKKETKQSSAAGQERSVKKIRRKLCNFFDFQTSYKWQKLEEDWDSNLQTLSFLDTL